MLPKTSGASKVEEKLALSGVCVDGWAGNQVQPSLGSTGASWRRGDTRRTLWRASGELMADTLSGRFSQTHAHDSQHAIVIIDPGVLRRPNPSVRNNRHVLVFKLR